MKFKRGFSLLELLLVIAIAAGIFAFSTPFTLNFYRTQLVDEAQSNLIDALGRARHDAVLQKNDSNFGVHIVAGSYTIFQGNSYAEEGRDTTQDEVFPVADNITFTGLSDIIFSKLTGSPNATGTINIALDTLSRKILVDDSGGLSKTN
jgi:prepilin-type N-terminal cleavage/methylation domain-containing protein